MWFNEWKCRAERINVRVAISSKHGTCWKKLFSLWTKHRLMARRGEKRSEGGGPVVPVTPPPPPLCKPFLSKTPTIFRGENAMTIMFDTAWSPFEKSWLRACITALQNRSHWKTITHSLVYQLTEYIFECKLVEHVAIHWKIIEGQSFNSLPKLSFSARHDCWNMFQLRDRTKVTSNARSTFSLFL